jgi:predicted secreted protein
MLKRTLHRSSLLPFMLLVSLTQPVLANDKAYFDRINLSAQAVADVANDTLVMVLAAQRQGNDVVKLAGEVNLIMSQAIKRCKQVEGIEVQTLDYQTSPIYEKQHQTGWRVSQSIQLKSKDSKALSTLVDNLQNTLMLESMHYQVSPEQRNKAEESLIGKAIAAFQHRAQNITQHLGRQRYRLVNMQVDTGNAFQQPIRMQTYQAFDAVRATAPAIEPGKQRVTVTVSGVIELVLN